MGTPGSGRHYWQTTSRSFPVQPQAQIHLSANMLSTSLLLLFCSFLSMSRSEFMRRMFSFTLCFCFFALGLWCLCHTVAGRILGKELKSTLSAIQTRITQTVGSPRHLSVSSVTRTRTHYTHVGIHHTNKLLRAHTHTHTTAKEATRAQGPALAPQQSAAVLTGATCCYCGLCGKAGMLPALQPAATEWTQYPDSRSHGPKASGPPTACLSVCLSALLSVQLSIIHQFGSSTRGHQIKCKSASHGKDATHWACHRAKEDSPMCLWQEAEKSGRHRRTTSFITHGLEQASICSIFCCCWVKWLLHSRVIEYYAQRF